MERQNSAGFQLLELLLVVALLVVVLGMGLERFDRLAQTTQLEATAATLGDELRRARSLAISNNLRVYFEVVQEPPGFQLRIAGGVPILRELPGGIAYTRVPRSPLQFHSRGTAAPAGSIEISNLAGSIRLIVSPTGRIRTEKNYHDR